MSDSPEVTIIKKGLSILIVILIPVFIAIILLFCYDLYIQHLNTLERKTDTERKEMAENNRQPQRIKRLFFLKYSHLNPKEEEIFYLIEELKIDNCKYIVLGKNDASPTIIHANDCEFCLEKETKSKEVKLAK